MLVTKQTQLRVCDICRNPIGGEVHAMQKGLEMGGEICSGCWAEPTPDMVRNAYAIAEACYQCHTNLKGFKDGFAVLYKGEDNYGVSVFQTLDDAKECALEVSSEQGELFDIFDHGVRMHASVFMEVRFAGR